MHALPCPTRWLVSLLTAMTVSASLCAALSAGIFAGWATLPDAYPGQVFPMCVCRAAQCCSPCPAACQACCLLRVRSADS